MTGIYIHIPFCRSKCPYCDFYSFKGDEKQKDSYLNAVLSALKKFKNQLTQADTIYFGGGTPSYFGGERIAACIDYIKNNFNLVNPEITVECNPSDVDEKLMTALSDCGVNRISMGMQSAVDSERKALGRLSDKKQISEALSVIRKSGISNISLDIMLGIPGQTKESLDESLDFLVSCGVTHISAYILKVEENTPFGMMGERLVLPDEEEVCQLYLHTSEKLARHGFAHYEISNFAKKGFESRHNLKYWNAEEYLGIGPSAHSFLSGRRFYYERSFGDFLEGCQPVQDGEGGDEEEYIMLRLRLSQGLRKEEYEKRFGKKIPEEIFLKAKKLPSSLINVTEDSVSLTAEGFLLSNTIIGELL